MVRHDSALRPASTLQRTILQRKADLPRRNTLQWKANLPRLDTILRIQLTLPRRKSFASFCCKVALLVAVLLPSLVGVSNGQIPPKGTASTFEVATWNIEWFGSGNGPSNDELQLANVIEIIRSADIDLWALQEIADPVDFNRLLDSLGAGYAGVLATYGQAQKTGFLYKTDVVDVREVRHILESFEDDFAGRPPLQLRATISSDPERIITFITVHMKANSQLTSYNKRLAASGRLKNHIDFSSLNNQMVVALGDFNDLLTGSISSSPTSPYANFVSDTQDYLFLTADLENDGRSTYCGNSCSSGSAIDHILISNELFIRYIDASVDHYDEVLSGIGSYLFTTSDHLPVFATFQLSTQTGIDEDYLLEPSVSLYPNPAKSRFVVSGQGFGQTDGSGVDVSVHDIVGRRIWHRSNGVASDGTIEIAINSDDWASGVYVVSIASRGQAMRRLVTIH